MTIDKLRLWGPDLSRGDPALEGNPAHADRLCRFFGGLGWLAHEYNCIVFRIGCQAKSYLLMFNGKQYSIGA